jgi:AraC family ethanolamine operon transcriptional activator
MTNFLELTRANALTALPFSREVAFQTFTSVDDQASAFKDWRLDYTQISDGVFHGSSSTVSFGGIRLLVEQLDKVVLQQGAVPKNRLAVAVPLQLEGHARMCGEKSDRDSLHVFSSAPEFEFYSPDRHLLVNVEIEPDKLASEVLRTHAAALKADTLKPIVPMATEVADSLRNLLRHTLSVPENTSLRSDVGNVERTELMERTVLYAISEAIAFAPVYVGNFSSYRNWSLVTSVQDLLNESATCPLSVSELCVQLGVSRRTVQYAFHEAVNLNPIAYLRAVRLNHARRELRRGESVTAAATKWGFWHLSGFAQDYRRLFGELPSITAKRYGSHK